MQIKDLGYEITGAPGIKKITITERLMDSEDDSSSYIEIELTRIAEDGCHAGRTFDLEEFGEFLAALKTAHHRACNMAADIVDPGRVHRGRGRRKDGGE